QLVELALSADTDTMDLIGGFEQIDHNREVSSLVQEILRFIQQNTISAYSSDGVSDSILPFLEFYEMIQSSDVSLEALCSALPMLLQSYQDPTLEQFLSRARDLFNLSRHSDKM